MYHFFTFPGDLIFEVVVCRLSLVDLICPVPAGLTDDCVVVHSEGHLLPMPLNYISCSNK
jgi:hypothetical protein